MKGIWIILPLVLVLSIFFSNEDRDEINQIGSIVSMGIDKENDQYQMTVQLANAGAKQANSKSQLSPITTFDGSGKTLAQAFSNIADQVPKKIDISHLQLVLISEELVKDEGIGPILDLFLREKKTSTQFPLAVVKKSKAGDMLKIFTPVQDFPALDIRSLLLNVGERYSSKVFTSPINLLTELYKEGKDVYLPALEINGDLKKGRTIENTQTLDPTTSISLKGFSVFHHSNYVDTLSMKEGFIYFLSQGSVKEGYLETICSKGKKASLKIKNIKSEKKIVKATIPTIKLSIKIDGTLTENNCNYITRSNYKKNEKDLEKRFEKELTNKLNKLIQKSKEINSDFIGFGNTYYLKHPQKWKRINDDFLNHVLVKTSVTVNIQDMGEVNFKSKFPTNTGAKK